MFTKNNASEFCDACKDCALAWRNHDSEVLLRQNQDALMETTVQRAAYYRNEELRGDLGEESHTMAYRRQCGKTAELLEHMTILLNGGRPVR